MSGILSRIKPIDFPKNKYFKDLHKKLQVTIHHTVSPQDSIKGDVATWLNSKYRIATAIIIAGDGTPYQLFSSKYWAYHLGIKRRVFNARKIPYQRLDKISIGVEIDAAGGLTKKGDGKWYDYYGHHISTNEVIEYPDGFRGYYGFQKYTSDQIETLKDLLIFWNNRYDIPLKYNEDMWDVSDNALKGEAGIWSHVSYRSDKSDCHPQPELIEMLRSLDEL